MPHPLELLLDPISITVFAIYAGLIGWEALLPARPLPWVKGWRIRGLAAGWAASFIARWRRCCRRWPAGQSR